MVSQYFKLPECSTDSFHNELDIVCNSMLQGR